jgi:FKBP-type peptidyl-prolyl cis-trans isomerase
MKHSLLAFTLLSSLSLGACRRTPSPVAPPATAPNQATTSDLEIEDLKVGNGPPATSGTLVQIHYDGYLPDGTKFDSTRARKPLQFQLGQGTVLKGWDLGIEGMKVGGQRKLTVPPALAFGDRTVGQIKPNSTLVFDVELVSVKKAIP